jgi:hypothetical protein
VPALSADTYRIAAIWDKAIAEAEEAHHAHQRGSALHDAVGATRTFRTPPYPSTHNLGTNQMSANARHGVVNKFGQTHDIEKRLGRYKGEGGAARPVFTVR